MCDALTEEPLVRVPGVLSVITGQYSEITPLKAAGQKGYSLPVGFLFQEEGAPLPAQILAGQRRWGRAPMSYDSVYPTFRTAVQARNGLGRGLRGGHVAAMSRL